MAERLWYPYAPDQQFGVRAAADSEALDRLLALMESRQPEPPRPGNKAPLPGHGNSTPGSSHAGISSTRPGTSRAPRSASWRPVAEWLVGSSGPTRGAPGDAPSTTASALEASPWVRTDG
jgi:hypothetical protein